MAYGYSWHSPVLFLFVSSALSEIRGFSAEIEDLRHRPEISYVFSPVLRKGLSQDSLFTSMEASQVTAMRTASNRSSELPVWRLHRSSSTSRRLAHVRSHPGG